MQTFHFYREFFLDGLIQKLGNMKIKSTKRQKKPAEIRKGRS